MDEPSSKLKDDDPVLSKIRYIQYAIEKIGFPLLVCIFLGWLVWKKIDQLSYKIDRTIRNTRSLMDKAGIPVIVGKDDWNPDK